MGLVTAGQNPNQARYLDKVRLTWAKPEFNAGHDRSPLNSYHDDTSTEFAREVTDTFGTGRQWLRNMMTIMRMRIVIVTTIFIMMIVA